MARAGTTAPVSPSARDAPAWPSLSPAHAAGLAAAWAIALALVGVFAHPTPFYTVETDLVGEYLPAAAELLRGVLDVTHYAFKGPGYPLLVAALAAPLHGDVTLAAKLLSPLAAAAAAWFAYAIARATAGATIATFTLLALLSAPVLVRYAIEAGTDAPALALMLAATWLLLRGGVPSLLAAGLCAGYATITRANAAFLLPCAAVVLLARPRRVQSLAAYALGAAVPLAAWAAAAARTGGLPPDRNYLNVAWELYGYGVPWDRFEASAGTRFHSLLEVLRFDPPRAAGHIARNLFTQRVADVRELAMPWLGVVAVPGLVLLARTRARRAWLLHAAACALVLAPVFYNARFALYLLPVYAAAAGMTLAWVPSRAGRSARAATAAMAIMAAGIVAWGAVTAVRDTRTRLATAPHEVRLAGEALARTAAPGTGNRVGGIEGIMARKPHVAYFAHRAFVPFPSAPRLEALPAWALAHHARYLFFSGLEQQLRPGYAVLADSGVSLPGFEQVLWGRLDDDHFWSVFRLSPVTADSATFAAAYYASLMRHEARHPNSAAVAVYVAAQLIAIGRPAEALARLDRVTATGAHDAALDRFRAEALTATGDLDAAAAACEQAMRRASPVGSDWNQLGIIRARQGRFIDAREAYAKAVALEPANVDYLEQLGRAEVVLEQYAAAGATFERRVRLMETDVQAWRFAIAARQLAGDTARARTLFLEGVAAGIPPRALVGSP